MEHETKTPLQITFIEQVMKSAFTKMRRPPSTLSALTSGPLTIIKELLFNATFESKSMANLVRVRAKVAPSLAEPGPNQARIGPTSAEIATSWSKSNKSGPTSVELARCKSNLGRIWPTSSRNRSKALKAGRLRAKIARPNLAALACFYSSGQRS